METEPLDVGEYTTTEKFKSIERHTCVCKHDGALVAVTGPADDREAIEYAILFAAAPDLLEALEFCVQNRVELGPHTTAGAVARAAILKAKGLHEPTHHAPTGLAAIMGRWPGDETDEEIAKALEELS
jgi:hypothetical protein